MRHNDQSAVMCLKTVEDHLDPVFLLLVIKPGARVRSGDMGGEPELTREGDTGADPVIIH